MIRGLLVTITATITMLVACLAPSLVRCEDCNENGVDDALDVEHGTSADCNTNGRPDECDVVASEWGVAPEAWSIPSSFEMNTRSIYAVDFNGAGGLDFLVDCGNALCMSLDGGPWELVPYGANQGLLSADDIVVDVDGDLDLDVGVALPQTRSVNFLINDGAGRLVSVSRVDIGAEPRSLAGSDLDGDGSAEFVVVVPAALVIVEDSGDGPRASTTFPVGSNPQIVRTADFNGDGHADVATANRVDGAAADNVSVLLNDGSGQLGLARHFAVAKGVSAFIALDVDGDGDMDLATLGDGGRLLTVFENDGQGRLAARASMIPAASGRGTPALFPFDVDGDSDLDLVSGGDFTLLLNDGSGRFQRTSAARPSPSWSPSLVARSFALVDLDGDARLELLSATNRGLKLLHGALLPRSDDCDRDGVPDECQSELGSECEDCNLNNIPDEQELSMNSAVDRDENGRIDACELAEVIALDFVAPDEVFAEPGTERTIPVDVRMHLPEGTIALAWMALVGVEGAEVASATLEGTARGDENYFSMTGIAVERSEGCRLSALSAVTTHRYFGLAQPRGTSPPVILKLELAVSVPTSGVASCNLEILSRSRCDRAVLDGGQVFGRDARTYVDVGLHSVPPTLVPKQIRIVPARPFHRGDADVDGALTIVDAVRIIGSLFVVEGGYGLPCPEAADANNDGAIDVSDGVRLLRYLFMGEAPPVGPGPPPDPCGLDPDDPLGSLSCPVYERC